MLEWPGMDPLLFTFPSPWGFSVSGGLELEKGDVARYKGRKIVILDNEMKVRTKSIGAVSLKNNLKDYVCNFCKYDTLFIFLFQCFYPKMTKN